MKGQEEIRTKFERNRKALQLRPSIGQGTAVTRVRLIEGLTCEIEEAKWKLTADMGEKSGGANRGPNPGILGRAALGSCLAIGYAMWAAKMDVPYSSLEVEVQAAYDSRGGHGVDEIEPGYTQIRYVVTIESEAPESAVVEMLDQADAHSDFWYVFARPQELKREVRIVAPTAGGAD